MNTTALKTDISNQTKKNLRQRCLICDGNAHRPDLFTTEKFNHPDIIHEYLLPTIRTTALQIALMHHDWTKPSPAIFTEEADWFAARIVVLGVREFHLDVELMPMLKLANKRAQTFAHKHGLSFQEATIRASLHNNRPANVLLIMCDDA